MVVVVVVVMVIMEVATADGRNLINLKMSLYIWFTMCRYLQTPCVVEHGAHSQEHTK